MWCINNERVLPGGKLGIIVFLQQCYQSCHLTISLGDGSTWLKQCWLTMPASDGMTETLQFCLNILLKAYYELSQDRTCFCHMQTKAQIRQRSLPCAFAICLLDSIIPKFAISEITRLLLASVAEQADLSLTLSHNFKGSSPLERLSILGLVMRKPVFALCEQQSIGTVWSVPFLFAAWIV